MQARVFIAALAILTMLDAIGMSFGMAYAPREEGNTTATPRVGRQATNASRHEEFGAQFELMTPATSAPNDTRKRKDSPEDSPGDLAVKAKPGSGSPGVPRGPQFKSSLKLQEIDRHVVDLYKATDRLKLTGQGSNLDVWQHTVANMLGREGLQDMVSLEPEGVMFQSHVDPMVREVVARIETIYKDPKRWALWAQRWNVPMEAINDFRHLFCDYVPPRYSEGGVDHELFNSGADGRRSEHTFYEPRPIEGFSNINMPRIVSSRQVNKLQAEIAHKMKGTQSGNGLGNDTYSTGVNHLLERTATPIQTSLTVVWVANMMTTTVVLAYFQDAAKLFKRTPGRAQTTTGMRNIKTSHSPSDFIMFSMSLNGEASFDVYKGMDNCREYCQRKTTATVQEGWDATFGTPGSYPVSYAWGGDHCNLMSQAGLVHGTCDDHYRCPCCITKQKDFMSNDMEKDRCTDESKRRTAAKQRMWAHAVEGKCPVCKVVIKEGDVLDRAKAQARMTHAQQLKHAAAHFGVLPGHGPMLDGESGVVDADLVSDIMHAATNITSFLIVNTLFKFLPAPNTSTNRKKRENVIAKLTETVEKLPINLYNFGIKKKANETCTPSPTGPEAYTLIFCFPALIDVVHPKDNPQKRAVTACWEALLAMYIVHWDTTVGDTKAERVEYKHALRKTASALMEAVITAIGTSSSCVYFHICLWHLPHYGYKYGPLAQFCTEAIEGNNATLKHINTNGQKLAADGDQVEDDGKRKRKKCTISVPMQIMRSKEVQDTLSKDLPIRVRMRRAHRIINCGWRNIMSYEGWEDHDADTKPTTKDALSIGENAGGGKGKDNKRLRKGQGK